MLTYPSLRVAYIDEREATINGRSEMVYYSVLVKGGHTLDEEIYRIKLPGNPSKIGEGKPENQNHAIIFTRGEALQTIDMNQDNYFEEAFKMRNVLEEFHKDQRGQRRPTNIGVERTYLHRKCIITSLVHVQPGDKFCDNWPKGFSRPSEGAIPLRSPRYI
ncbi:unnamed protein product [Lactuca virosa]|uniref:Glycosyl transferase 48 domain-containing protein n=1 Tax=Lactuca virosa TaxID=75947 RepID=A0AAU9LN00_9ASTR|nr:unnamed protein product [Lactuca virosa]